MRVLTFWASMIFVIITNNSYNSDYSIFVLWYHAGRRRPVSCPLSLGLSVTIRSAWVELLHVHIGTKLHCDSWPLYWFLLLRMLLGITCCQLLRFALQQSRFSVASTIAHRWVQRWFYWDSLWPYRLSQGSGAGDSYSQRFMKIGQGLSLQPSTRFVIPPTTVCLPGCDTLLATGQPAESGWDR